jgi:hypothetical protein
MTNDPLGSIPIDDLPFNISFWRSLCPDLTIREDASIRQRASDRTRTSLRERDWSLCRQLIHEDGYFAYEAFFAAEYVDRLANGLAQLDRRGIPPVFCFLYDEFWEVPLGVEPMLADLLGDHLVLPAVWAWIVKSTDPTAFEPHRDWTRPTSLQDPNHLDYLTLWIPLTDLSHLTSNIFLLPASLDANYDQNTRRVSVDNLQDIRCLQVPCGSVLGWAVGLAHWGSKQSRHGRPRMSVGYYVQKSSVECVDGPPIDLNAAFSFQQRLNLIGHQILNYSRDRGNALIEFAKRLVEYQA